MDDRGKAGLYLALTCIDRLAHHLEARKLEVPGVIRDFLDDAWDVLKGSKRKPPLAKMDRQLDRLVVDEQDAGFEQSLLNRLHYALSHLILYLESGDPASVEGVLEEALDLFDYEAAQEYLVATGGVAVVLDASDEEKIASDPRIVSERARQAEDRQRVRMPVDWHSIERGADR